jgi:hypothetical protein
MRTANWVTRLCSRRTVLRTIFPDSHQSPFWLLSFATALSWWATTGAMHLASAVSCKAVSITPGIEFPNSIERWGRRDLAVRHPIDCAPCYCLTHCPQVHNKCMSDISVESVFSNSIRPRTVIPHYFSIFVCSPFHLLLWSTIFISVTFRSIRLDAREKFELKSEQMLHKFEFLFCSPS